MDQLKGAGEPAAAKGPFLTFSSSVRPYDEGDLEQAFRDMLDEYAKPVPASKFGEVARAAGTHILKFNDKNVPLGEHILRFPPRNSNGAGDYLPSPNAADSPIAKIIFRKIAILDQEGSRSLVQHIIAPDNVSDGVTAAFAAVFGDEALDAVRQGLMAARTSVNTLWHENFPIVFVPGPDGSDLQLTPIVPAASWAAMRGVMDAYFRELEQGEDFRLVRRGARRTRQEVSSKLQNICPSISGPRQRFLAAFPQPLTSEMAEIWRYAHGGARPIMRGGEIEELARSYLGLHRTVTGTPDKAGYSNADIRRGMANLARWMVRSVREFVEEINEAALEVNPDFSVPETDITEVILRRRWKSNEELLAIRAALNAGDFQKHVEEV
ncbi:hypothetical protein [Defluviimonas salinarum]|uniref:Phage portal protein n=1 Tax=Defluviimonas salinarum TaxID=2992147 RepID=A0ABT3J9L9_9RHOB|nr:hypothetical protein [Defluviimonas salinarum]MCW3784386.1 hypothetical protein [Defluviimonas salinarum]